MRTLILALGFSLGAAPALAMEPMNFHMVRAEIDGARVDGENVFTWESDAWIGGDRNKFWLKSEGEIANGEASSAEVQALWSRNVAAFWDVQAGVRVDLEPDSRTYLALGVQGLAPYRFETEATAFISEDGDVSVRLHQSLDFHLTQRLVVEPHVEVNAYAHDDAERGVGAGLADVEAGAQVRYEITRTFAPYVDLTWERALGETASLRRASGAEVSESAIRAGIRVWF
jgi:copper resistance protein B